MALSIHSGDSGNAQPASDNALDHVLSPSDPASDKLESTPGSQMQGASGAGLFHSRYASTEDPLVPAVSPLQMSLRHDVRTMADARTVGLSLIDGQTQILNLEQVAPDLASRIVDFLDGVAFALEGSVENISGAVYLIVPGGVTVQKQDAS